jgi:hypothetical protein
MLSMGLFVYVRPIILLLSKQKWMVEYPAMIWQGLRIEVTGDF